jgi:hypothetical protein
MAAWPQHCGRFVSAAVTIVLLASSCGGTITAANPHPYHPGKECGHRGQTAAALFEELRAGGCGTLEYKGPSPLLPPEIDELAELLTDDWAFRELDLLLERGVEAGHGGRRERVLDDQVAVPLEELALRGVHFGLQLAEFIPS